MPQPLPPNPYPPGPWHDAYNRCLDFETHAPDFPAPRSGPTRLICARLLGYIVLEAPGDKGRDTMSREIMSAANGAALDTLAKYFLHHFIRCCEYRQCLPHLSSNPVAHSQVCKGRTPTPSNHPTRPITSKICWDIYLKRVLRTIKRQNSKSVQVVLWFDLSHITSGFHPRQ